MEKLSLNLESLAVETFGTTEALPAEVAQDSITFETCETSGGPGPWLCAADCGSFDGCHSAPC